MNYRLLDADGKTLAVGRDLARLKAEFGANASTAFAGVPDWRIQCDNVTRWDFGSLPPEIRQRHGDSEVVGYPALTIEGLCGNCYALYAIGLLVLFQLGFTYLAPMQVMFDTTAISLDDWLRISVVASSVLFLVEAEKLILRKYTKFGRRI